MHKLDANPGTDAIQIEAVHHTGHGEQQSVQKTWKAHVRPHCTKAMSAYGTWSVNHPFTWPSLNTREQQMFSYKYMIKSESRVMSELTSSLTAVWCQPKQPDGEYSGRLHASHNAVLMSQLGLGPGAALCRSSDFLCWPSPDSEKCWAGWSRTALEQRTLSSTHQPYCMCPVKAIVRIVLMCYISTLQTWCNQQHRK